MRPGHSVDNLNNTNELSNNLARKRVQEFREIFIKAKEDALRA